MVLEIWDQNNRLLEAEAVSASLESRIALQDLALNNRYLPEIDVKLDRGDELTPEEEVAVYRRNVRVHLGWQKEYLLWQAGVLDEELFRANFGGMLAFAGQSTGRAFWQRWRSGAALSYSEFVENCVLLECDDFPR